LGGSPAFTSILPRACFARKSSINSLLVVGNDRDLFNVDRVILVTVSVLSRNASSVARIDEKTAIITVSAHLK
jgi:hypothetical protein